MQNEQMPDDDPVLTGNHFQKILLDFIRIGVFRQSKAPGKSSYMCIDNNTFCHRVGIAQNNVGGLTPYPRKLHERGHIRWYFPAISRHKLGTTAP
jgi:hypothetical protein